MNENEYIDRVGYIKWWVKPQVPESRWFELLNTIKSFVDDTVKKEKGTLTYLVYTTNAEVTNYHGSNKPPVGPRQLFFVETYLDDPAFQVHLKHFDIAIAVPYNADFVSAQLNRERPLILVENTLRYRKAGKARDLSCPAGFYRDNFPAAGKITQAVKWWTKPGLSAAQQTAVYDCLYDYAKWAEHNESGTVAFMFSLPEKGSTTNVPPVPDSEIVIFAAYQSEQAHVIHDKNWHQQVIAVVGQYLMPSPDFGYDYPYVEVTHLSLVNGIVRGIVV